MIYNIVKRLLIDVINMNHKHVVPFLIRVFLEICGLSGMEGKPLHLYLPGCTLNKQRRKATRPLLCGLDQYINAELFWNGFSFSHVYPKLWW